MTTNWKKYQSIVRHGKTFTQELVKDGEIVVVWEKLDGANASFMLNEDGGEVLCFSRNNPLTGWKDGLRGFYEWVQSNIDKEKLDVGKIYFGEWLVRHKIDYGEHENNFYLFDTLDLGKNEFMSVAHVIADAEKLNIKTAPIMAVGTVGVSFTFEQIQALVGTSLLAPDGVGEGVVIKNYLARSKDGSQLFTKIVTKEFQEANGVKSPKTVQSKADPMTQFVQTYLTEARVEKLLGKLVDEGVIKEDYDITDMGAILKGLGSSVADDILSEESDELFKVVKQRVGRAVPTIVKNILEKR